MRSLLYTILCLALLTKAPSAFACPPNVYAAMGDERPYVSLYEAQRAESLAALRKTFPDIVDIGVQIKQDENTAWENTARVYVVRAGNRREFVRAKYHFEITAHTLRSYVTVAPNLRDAGLNKLMVLAALKANPSIKEKSEDLMASNRAAFVMAVTTEETDTAKLRSHSKRYEEDERTRATADALLGDEVMGLKSRRQVQAFRNRVLSAYREHTPAGRLNVASGFNKINYLEITLGGVGGEVGIHVDVEKGAQDPEAPPRIVVRDVRTVGKRETYELFPDGGFRRLQFTD